MKRFFLSAFLFFTSISILIAAELSIQEKVEGRNFPSICSMVTINYNLPLHVSANENTAYHDIMWAYSYSLKFSRVDGRIQLVGSPENVAIHDPGGDPIKNSTRSHEEIRSYNSNLVFMFPLPTRAVGARSVVYGDLFDEIPWLRDTVGNFISGNDRGPSHRIDFSHPHYIDMLVEMAVAVDNHEFYDGIIFDSFGLGSNILPHLTLDEEEGARVEILRRIREAVSDNFLILASGYNWNAKILAPYINGIYMESYRAIDDNYSYNGLKGIEESLTWAENNLQTPLINCLEAEGLAQESPKSPRNQQWMRLFTTLSLTHSDGYVVYTMGVQSEPHQHDAEFQHPHPHVNHLTDTNFGHGNDPLGVNHGHSHHHYWYDFYDAELGRPMGEKAQLYENQEGLFIREFTNGWAVYNRSGKERKIYLPEKVSGVESGVKNKHWHTIPDLDGEIFLKQMTPTPEPSIGTQNRYDVDSDGNVDVTDVRLVVLALGQKDKNITNPRTDVNKNNKVDKNDVLLVIDNLDDANGAPLNTDLLSPISEETMHLLNPTILHSTLKALRLENDGSLKYQQAIALLESILAALRPDATQLLANYPNPFNPETWIPYQLATNTDVEIRIYDTQGILVRSLALGHQRAGIYTGRGRAAYWDGRNAVGERVASGIYFYQLQADNVSLLRKMLILK